MEQIALLSDSANDMAELFTAAQLIRMRDRMKGTPLFDCSEWLEPMQWPELDIRQQAANPGSARKKQGNGRKGDECDSILWRLAFFERDFALWREVFTNEVNNIAKFLSLLANLQLDVSYELDELKSLNRRNEVALLRMDQFTKKLRSIVAGERLGGSMITPRFTANWLGLRTPLRN